MARTVADAVAVLSVLTAPDERDQITVERPVEVPADYTAFLDPTALRGARVGVARQFF